MIEKPAIKVCGITREPDLDSALELGARYIGLNIYRKSPRGLPKGRVQTLLPKIPKGKRVMVDVATEAEALSEMRRLGFDFFQIHFELSVPVATVARWSATVGKERLWLAPKLPPQEQFPEYLFEHADTILLDAYSTSLYGGTGIRGDWARFKRLSDQFPETGWVLAGGISPDNIVDAVRATGARIVDVNSGVESSPGINDPELLRRLFACVNEDTVEQR